VQYWVFSMFWAWLYVKFYAKLKKYTLCSVKYNRYVLWIESLLAGTRHIFLIYSLNVRLCSYEQKLKGKQAWWNKQKLKDIENVDLYLLNATDDGVSSVMDNFPKICFGDIYVYLIFKKVRTLANIFMHTTNPIKSLSFSSI
jgi:hypothetical protein